MVSLISTQILLLFGLFLPIKTQIQLSTENRCGLPVNEMDDVSAKILGGAEVSIYDFPWQISLAKSIDIIGPSLVLSHICGGSIIHPKWVLTAAHCLVS